MTLTAVIVLGLIAIALGFGLLGFLRCWREQGYDLQDKGVLITGGSRGLGLVMARQLVDAGARLAICARDEAELARARADLAQRGGEVLALICDVTNQAQVDQIVQQVSAHFGAIDILINNAGTDIVGPFENMAMQDYDDLMQLHFWAPLYATYAVLPEMRARRAGRIVNISSVGGKVVSPHMVAYCASKFALTGLSAGMRVELAQAGIAVTTVCPGLIYTGVNDHALFKGQRQKEYAWFSISESLPLLSASPEKVAREAIAGLRRGAAEVVVPLPILLMARFYGVFPGVMASLLRWGNWLLPGPTEDGDARAFGRDSHSAWAPSWLTSLSDRAARRNNELPVNEPKAAPPVTPGGSRESSPEGQAVNDL
ncbi:SDR family NAD(P)-dependent oxidoreductase [Leptolyngbya sp. KIOST-1]|uniref:SDR family NAD(P)-dependent oxidoreductase n=1 Tax=Leptolyngbya sp. KIOST-1 TaxID=1229172 RepID=UPI0009079D62|nr:SDR family NAD(P)-dependent oxidoreductase [Leptolyngbya sp. KIOST-1]